MGNGARAEGALGSVLKFRVMHPTCEVGQSSEAFSSLGSARMVETQAAKRRGVSRSCLTPRFALLWACRWHGHQTIPLNGRAAHVPVSGVIWNTWRRTWRYGWDRR